MPSQRSVLPSVPLSPWARAGWADRSSSLWHPSKLSGLGSPWKIFHSLVCTVTFLNHQKAPEYLEHPLVQPPKLQCPESAEYLILFLSHMSFAGLFDTSLVLGSEEPESPSLFIFFQASHDFIPLYHILLHFICPAGWRVPSIKSIPTQELFHSFDPACHPSLHQLSSIFWARGRREPGEDLPHIYGAACWCLSQQCLQVILLLKTTHSADIFLEYLFHLRFLSYIAASSPIQGGLPTSVWNWLCGGGTSQIPSSAQLRRELETSKLQATPTKWYMWEGNQCFCVSSGYKKHRNCWLKSLLLTDRHQGYGWEESK